MELLASLGNCEGMQPAFILFEEGLLYPDVVEDGQLKSFEHWLQQAAAVNYAVVAHPFVAERAVAQDLGLPELPGCKEAAGIREADGLDWPLRLARSGSKWLPVRFGKRNKGNSSSAIGNAYVRTR